MAKVNFIRKHTKAEVNDEPIVDGNFIVTGDGGTFIDYGEERVPINGTIVVKNEETESDTDVYSCNYINGIIESGSNSNGNWTKFADGTMICTRTITVTIDCTNSWGSLYYGQNNDKFNFAQSFIEPPILNLQYTTNEAISFIPIVYSGIVVDNDGFKRIEIARPNSVTNISVKVYFIAIGKWK